MEIFFVGIIYHRVIDKLEDLLRDGAQELAQTENAFLATRAYNHFKKKYINQIQLKKNTKVVIQ